MFNLISPKLGLSLIKKELEKQTSLQINDFSIFYVKKYDNLKFKICDNCNISHDYEFEDKNGQLSGIIQTQILSNLDNKNIIIDAFTLSYIDREVLIDIYYQNEKGTKIKQTMQL